MRTAYFDAFSGLSGDMIAGAMLDVGADFGRLKDIVDALQLPGCKLSTRRKSVSGIEALRFEVDVLDPDGGLGVLLAVIGSRRVGQVEGIDLTQHQLAARQLFSDVVE